jgi:hypothetical protein
MTDMMVAAGIDAAGDLDLQIADLGLPLGIAEAVGNLLRHGDRAGIGQRAIVEPRAGDDIGDQAGIGCRQAISQQRPVERLEIGQRHMRQHQVLLVGDADLVVGELLGEPRHRIHLVGGRIAGNSADRLQGNRHHGVVRVPVRRDIAADPLGKPGIGLLPGGQFTPALSAGFERGRREIGIDGGDVGVRQLQLAILEMGPLGLDLGAQLLDAGFMDQDLDARLVLVVAAAVQIVDPHDRRGVAQKIGFGQEVPDLLGQDRRPPLPAADPDGEAEFTLIVPFQLQADIVYLDRRAVALRSGHRDLELARQEREFGMDRRPLPQNLGIGTRIGDLISGCTGEMVGGDIADAIARCLDRVHLDFGQFLQDAGMSDSAGQLYWMFCRVVKWP